MRVSSVQRTVAGVTALADLSDVTSSTATNQNLLVANGTSWESANELQVNLSTGAVNVNGGVFQVGGSTVIDASRNVDGTTLLVGGTTVVDATRNILNVVNLTMSGLLTIGADVVLKRIAAGELAVRNAADSAYEALRVDELKVGTTQVINADPDIVNIVDLGMSGLLTIGADVVLKRIAAGELAVRNAADTAYEAIRVDEVKIGTTQVINADPDIVNIVDLNMSGTLTVDGNDHSVGNNTDNDVRIDFQSNRTATDTALARLDATWNGTVVGRIDIVTGDDTVNKDDGYVAISTAEGGVLSEALRVEQDKSVVVFADAPATPVLDHVYKESIVRAWCLFTVSAGSPSLQQDFNVTSITDNGAGDFTVNFATALASATYAVVGNSDIDSTVAPCFVVINSRAAGSVRLHIYNSGGTQVDPTGDVTAVVFGGF